MSVELTIANATLEDVGFVFGHLWERGRLELEVLGLTPEEGCAYAAGLLGAGPTVVFAVDSEPVLVTGMVPIVSSPGGMATWFQATAAFSSYAIPITRELRRRLDEYAAQNGIQFVEIVSPCVHPRTGRWFGALGFTLDVNRYIPNRTGIGRLYRFERRFQGASDVPHA